jgi:UMF1 family MFS transporter
MRRSAALRLLRRFAAYFTQQVAANEIVGSALWGNTLAAVGMIVAVYGPVRARWRTKEGGRSLGLRRPPSCVGATALLWFVQPSTSYVWLAMVLVGLGTPPFSR